LHSAASAPAAGGGGGGGFTWDGFKSAAGELQGQNTQLMNQLSRAEAEVVRLRGHVEQFRSLQETVASDSPADAKVIQLAKKVKTLAVAGWRPILCPCSTPHAPLLQSSAKRAAARA
jgi:hypothetical protein